MKPFLIFLFFGLLALTTQAQPIIISGQVTRIIDRYAEAGDTFEMLQDSKRVHCPIVEQSDDSVDAPEKGQPYGESTDSLSKLMLNKPIVCLLLGRDVY
jgi:hypothetical protein